MKKIFSILLSILITVSVLTAMPIISHADAGQSGDWKYWTENGELWLTGYTGDATEVEIPSELDGKKVDYLNATFAENPFVTSVVIPNTVKEIGFETFNMCESLASVTIPDSVTKIGEWAFSNCFSLETLSIPSSVEKIETGAFAYSALKSIVIPDSVKTVGSYLFHYCEDLTDVTLPNTLTSLPTYNPDGIYYGFFAHCKSLETVKLPDNLTSIDVMAFNQCLSLKSIHIPKSVTSIGWFAFADCPALESITVDSENTVFDSRDNCNAVIETATKTLAVGCKNTVVPNGIEHIGDSAFSHCSTLKSIVIPEGVKVINIEAFLNCTGLESVTIPDSITRINGSAFYLASDTMTVTSSCNTPDVYEKVIKGTHRKWNKKHAYKTATTKATLAKDGKIETKCTKCGDIKSSTPISRPKTIKLSSTAYIYNNKVKKPSVTVTDAKGKKIPASNYTVKYAKGRKKIGAYTVTVTFKGNYTGTKKLTFKINPKGTKLTSVNGGTKSFTANWKKQTKNTTGYQIQYSTDKNFESGNKTVTVKDNTKTSKKVKNLKAKKVYYVRVRTYKQIGDKKFTSTWSDPIKVKTK